VHFDGNPVDMATIGIAVCACIVRPIKRKWTKSKLPCFDSRDVIVDFLNGTVIVPFCLLVGSTFSHEVLEEAIKSNKLFFSICGVIALIFVVKELINGE
jgi:hypothetical protein